MPSMSGAGCADSCLIKVVPQTMVRCTADIDRTYSIIEYFKVFLLLLGAIASATLGYLILERTFYLCPVLKHICYFKVFARL